MLRIGLSLLLAIVVVGGLEGQAQPDRDVAVIASRWVPEPLPPVFALESDFASGSILTRRAVIVPDSVRRKVGYQHWKGGAIGAAAGGVVGLLLGLASGACDDCSSNDSVLLEAALAGAGLGGAFGFLVGAASPKYRWETRHSAPKE
jgi:hypothetical protein